ncbi:MAG: response regulator transcription factor [Kordiimonas sp.]
MTQALHILIVEDQEAIAENVAAFMEPKGHVLDFAYRGDHGLELALSNTYDVIVLDLMLPRMDGLEVCEMIRKKSTRHVPILMLTARDTTADKIKGFQQGADDYLTKPFVLEELEMRCMALSRRHLLNVDHTITLGPLEIDRQRQSIKRDGKAVELKQVGYKIVEALAEAFPQVVTRSELTQKIWGDEPTESDALRSHIYQVRSALDKPFSQPLLKTVHGVGFTLAIEQGKESS